MFAIKTVYTNKICILKTELETGYVKDETPQLKVFISAYIFF